MIDVHTHVLPFVDDGSRSVESSLLMVKEAVAQGVTDMVLTPHLRGDYNASPERLKSVYNDFCDAVKNAGIEIKLYLGQEIFIDKDFKKLFSTDKILTLNGSKFVLIEFDYVSEFDIGETVYELVNMGYVPVIAHFERYVYADSSVAEEVKSLGGFIQVNADSFFGKAKKVYYKKIKELFKDGLVDFVASDVHAFRENYLNRAYGFVLKKFGVNTADAVFTNNALKILNGQT